MLGQVHIRARPGCRDIKAFISEKTDQQKWRKRRGTAGGRPVAGGSPAYVKSWLRDLARDLPDTVWWQGFHDRRQMLWS
ncbi:hypothetical protein K8Z49_09885 [Actinomadura madurae]|uniref:hypothetical protein n=1 Tax=Actinomadura madurae TaxID=1993 RepID=UPI00399AD7E4